MLQRLPPALLVAMPHSAYKQSIGIGRKPADLGSQAPRKAERSLKRRKNANS
jgi:hypothetical protein